VHHVGTRSGDFNQTIAALVIFSIANPTRFEILPRRLPQRKFERTSDVDDPLLLSRSGSRLAQSARRASSAGYSIKRRKLA
jgi:hypothetical protein